MRYIKITGTDMFWGKDELVKQDLIEIAEGRVDILIDTLESKYFSAKDNQWLSIPNNN